MNKKIYRHLFHVESSKSFILLSQVLAFCSLIKVWNLLQIFKTKVSLDSLILSLAFFAICGLYLQMKPRLCAFILSIFFYLCWAGQILPDSIHNFRTHHIQLLVLMLLGLCFLRKKQGVAFSLHLGSGFQMIRFVILTVYAGGILTKLNLQFLSGHQLKMLFIEYYWGNSWMTASYDRIFQLVAWQTLFTEICILIFLLFSRLRTFGVYLGILFHTLLFLVLPVSIFSFLMIAGLFLFLPPRITRPKS